MKIAWIMFVAAVTSGVAGQAAKDGPTIPTIPGVDPELLRLVVEDQWDRGMDMFAGRMVKTPGEVDWQAVARRDEQRQAAVRAMLRSGNIRTPPEQRFAALIFQHSDRPGNLSLAHVLASTAAIGGERSARWLAAATLDRYLQAVNQSQVFGTQFKSDAQGGWTMEPYDRDAVSDSIRAEWCVVTLEEQTRILRDLQAGKPIASTSVPECAQARP